MYHSGTAFHELGYKQSVFTYFLPQYSPLTLLSLSIRPASELASRVCISISSWATRTLRSGLTRSRTCLTRSSASTRDFRIPAPRTATPWRLVRPLRLPLTSSGSQKQWKRLRALNEKVRKSPVKSQQHTSTSVMLPQTYSKITGGLGSVL